MEKVIRIRINHWIMILISYRFCGKVAGGNFRIFFFSFLKDVGALLWKALCSPDLEKDESV